MKHSPNAFSSITFKEDRYAWLSFILGTTVIALLLYAWLRPVPAELHASETRISNPLITILHYDRVSRETQDQVVNQSQLQAQLLAFQQQGFVAISLDELLGFYYANRPLPEKSLFLIFGNGYLETYVAVDPVLRKLKWPAMIAINTEAVTQRDTKYLYWDRLTRMVETGLWSVASSGHQTRAVIPIGPKGEQGRFLYHPRWLERENRLETRAEFHNRVQRDFNESMNIFRQEFPSYPVKAFSPLFKHAHQRTPASPYRQAVQSLFQMSFVDSFVGVNDRYSNPLALRRLRVRAEWNADALLTRVEHALQVPTIQGFQSPAKTVPWFESDGDIRETGSQEKGSYSAQLHRLHLKDQDFWIQVTKNGNRELWIPGGHWGESWILEFQFILEHGEIGVRQKHKEKSGEWRWLGKTDGVFFQRRNNQGVFENLAASPEGITRDAPYTLKIIKRGTGVSAWLNEVPLEDLPIPLHENFSGDIGVFVWAVDGAPSLWVTQPKLTLVPFEFQWLPGYPTKDEVQSVVERAKEISGVSLTTHILTNNGLRATSYNDMLYKMLAARYALDVIPTIEIALENDKALDGNKTLLSVFHEWLRQQDWPKVHLHVKGVPANLSRQDLVSPLLLKEKTARPQRSQWMVTSGEIPHHGKLQFHPTKIQNPTEQT